MSPGDDRLKEGRMTITLEDPQKGDPHPEHPSGRRERRRISAASS